MGDCIWPWEQSCSATPQNCINVPNNCPTTDPCKSLIHEFPGARSCSDVMNRFASRLGKRTHGSVIVIYVSDTQYTFQIRIGQTNSSLSLQISSGCTYPVTATLTATCSSTAQAQFGSLNQLLDWVLVHLK